MFKALSSLGLSSKSLFYVLDDNLSHFARGLLCLLLILLFYGYTSLMCYAEFALTVFVLLHAIYCLK